MATITADALCNPILPMMERNSNSSRSDEGSTPSNAATAITMSTVDDEESPLLSMADMDKIPGLHCRSQIGVNVLSFGTIGTPV